MKIRTASLLPAIAWFILSFILLTLPGSKFPETNWLDNIHVDKVVHVSLFAILVYLTYLPWKPSWNRKFLPTAFWIAFAACLYGIAMEFVQKYYVPHRSFDLWDMVADGVGCLVPYFWIRIKADAKKV